MLWIKLSFDTTFIALMLQAQKNKLIKIKIIQKGYSSILYKLGGKNFESL